jgi:hypothetical protein
MIGLSRKSVGLDQRCRQSIEKFHNRMSSFISGLIFLSTSGPCSKFNVLIMDSNSNLVVIPPKNDDESTENNLLEIIFNYPGGKARSEVWKVWILQTTRSIRTGNTREFRHDKSRMSAV